MSRRPGSAPDIPTRAQIQRTYRKRARRYDLATQLYRLAGFPLSRSRRAAVDALGLQPGGTVVDVGCGTGANLPLLAQAVGASGRIVGVDLTDAMLAKADELIQERGWSNVELVEADAGTYEFPQGVNGILSTYALTLSPRYEAVIERGARALAPGGRWVVLDLREPPGGRDWLIRLALPFVRPYCLTREIAARHPWEALRRSLPHTEMHNFYFGLGYLAIGEKPA